MVKMVITVMKSGKTADPLGIVAKMIEISNSVVLKSVTCLVKQVLGVTV